MSPEHAAYMHRALSLAALGKGQVSPNPCVGCVFVKNGRIIAEGYHKKFAGPHAEAVALQSPASLKGSTVYLTLEPCVHWGKTPPCAPQLIKSGIKQAYIAMKDPNPIMNGKGIRLLQKAGIKVVIGLEEQAARELNRSFITWMTKKRPYVTLKMAMTLDGKIASEKGDSKWISSPESRKLVHRLRSEADAVLVGASTAVKDNPALTSHGTGRDPIRIVLDPTLRTSPRLQMFQGKNPRTMIFTSPKVSAKRMAAFSKVPVQILRTSLKYGRFELEKVLMILSEMNVSHLFVEGGAETAWNFINQNLVDEILIFIAPKIAGGRKALTAVGGKGWAKISQAAKLEFRSAGRVGPDILIQARPIGVR